MTLPSLRKFVSKIVDVFYWGASQARGEGVFPVVIRDPQGTLEIDAAYRFLMNLRKPEGQLVVQ